MWQVTINQLRLNPNHKIQNCVCLNNKTWRNEEIPIGHLDGYNLFLVVVQRLNRAKKTYFTGTLKTVPRSKENILKYIYDTYKTVSKS